jgi:hypothetical protein
MNSLAVELNSILEGTVVPRLLSDLGHRMYFPKGIVARPPKRVKRLTVSTQRWEWRMPRAIR